MESQRKSFGLGEIIFGSNSKPIISEKTRYERDDLDEPKHKITNPELFAKTREILGNLISRRMKTSGGTDIDWLIEHNGGFMIFELKIFHDDRMVIPKAQMSAYEKLYMGLSKCRILFIGHDDIAFTNLDDPVWIFEMSEWKKGFIPHIEVNYTESHKNEFSSGFIVEREFMEKIDVKILRDKIDQIWSEFENS